MSQHCTTVSDEAMHQAAAGLPELEFARRRFEKGRMSKADWQFKQERIQEKIARAQGEYE